VTPFSECITLVKLQTEVVDQPVIELSESRGCGWTDVDRSDRVLRSGVGACQSFDSTDWLEERRTVALGRHSLRLGWETEGLGETGIASRRRSSEGCRSRSSTVRCGTAPAAQEPVVGHSWSGEKSLQISVGFEQQPCRAEKSALVTNED
jgi:hypothetical protein